MLATQNPIEYEGTYPLPEAQLDRFLLRMSVGYPGREDEWRCCAPGRARPGRGRARAGRRPRDAARDAARVEQVHVSEPVGLYMVESSRRRARRASIQVGASPRGSLALLKLVALPGGARGRDYVTPEDVKAVAVPALAHRLTLRPELWVQRISAEDVVRERLDSRADAGGRGSRAGRTA